MLALANFGATGDPTDLIFEGMPLLGEGGGGLFRYAADDAAVVADDIAEFAEINARLSRDARLADLSLQQAREQAQTVYAMSRKTSLADLPPSERLTPEEVAAFLFGDEQLPDDVALETIFRLVNQPITDEAEAQLLNYGIRIIDEDAEHLIAITSDGDVVGVWRGTRNAVVLEHGLSGLNLGTIHNHPYPEVLDFHEALQQGDIEAAKNALTDVGHMSASSTDVNTIIKNREPFSAISTTFFDGSQNLITIRPQGGQWTTDMFPEGIGTWDQFERSVDGSFIAYSDIANKALIRQIGNIKDITDIGQLQRFAQLRDQGNLAALKRVAQEYNFEIELIPLSFGG